MIFIAMILRRSTSLLLRCRPLAFAPAVRWSIICHNKSVRLRSVRNSSSALLFPESTTILFLSSLLPEPNASAAGVRTKSLLELLLQAKGVEAVHYGTGAKCNKGSFAQVSATQELENLGVKFHHVPPNNSEAMQLFLQHSNSSDKVLVIIDRFYSEEAYSFHIHKHLPNAMILLDMQDMHSLRWHRQAMVKSRTSQQKDPLSDLPLKDYPLAGDDKLKRELASIHRSDMTLVCSPVELTILKDVYGIAEEKLCLASFFTDQSTTPLSETAPFLERKNYVFIGGFRHEPNVDAIRQMKKVWPRIRQQVNEASAEQPEFHVFGPFCPRPLREECHDPAKGFFIHGFADGPARELLSKYRVLLAPLRFGAGIKGKIVDAWASGTPVVTTTVGSEGMAGDVIGEWGGIISHNTDDFVQASVALYTDKSRWNQSRLNAIELARNHYGVHNWKASALPKIIAALNNLQIRRETDYLRGVLWQDTQRSTEYFSRWIESKEHKT